MIRDVGTETDSSVYLLIEFNRVLMEEKNGTIFRRYRVYS